LPRRTGRKESQDRSRVVHTAATLQWDEQAPARRHASTIDWRASGERGQAAAMTIWIWVAFVALILLLLALDLGVLNRHDHVISTREALGWTGFWVALALLFIVPVYFIYENHWWGVGTSPGYEPAGWKAMIHYFEGWLVEKSLSLDNIFVIAMIFRFFGVPLQFQHRTLFWGIIGALVLRGAMIGAGVVLIRQFSWTIYIFGGFLILTAIKMMVAPDVDPDLENNRLVKLVRRMYPVSPTLEGHKFFTHIDGRRAITPLFLVLLLVESSDVVFAVDSIPAIFGITQDPFIVFTSNIFAILGLRSLYFVLAQLLHRFQYLQASLVVILAYVGAKMILSHHIEIREWISLTVIGGALFVGIVASVIKARYGSSEEEEGEGGEGDSAAGEDPGAGGEDQTPREEK
jgi:tellurite resistance protein TerC